MANTAPFRAKNGLHALAGVQFSQGQDVISATALGLTNDGNFVNVTGTTTITSFDSVGVGSWITIRFTGILTLTHHATNLILPSGASITTAVGDIAVFNEYASGNWRCISYTRADGTALVGAGGSVTSVDITAGTLIDKSGGPITSSGSIQVDVDLSEATEAVFAPATDYLLFLDGGISGTAAKESGADFATALAGSGLTATSGVLSTDNNGTVTSVDITAGTLIDKTGGPITTSGSITIDVDLSEASEAVYAPGTDYVLFLDGGTGGTAAKESGADFAASLAGVGLAASAGVLAFNGSELTDMTASVNGSEDELILLDNGADRRKLLSEIDLGAFNNDQNWNNYTHPSDGVDPGAALTGAFVFSDITVNAAGHVTGSATRALTAADISALDLSGGTLTGALTLSGDPTSNLHAATKQYVDSYVEGLSGKEAARVATDGNLPAYTQSGAGAGATLTASSVGILTVDGVNTVIGDRILVKNGTAADYGVYEVTTEGTAGVAFVLTRATDADTTAGLASAHIFVNEGTNNADTSWYQSAEVTTVDTTSQTWTQFLGTANTTVGNVGSGADVFKDRTGSTDNLRGLNSTTTDLTIAVNADNIDFTVNPANIDHDALQNYVANEHIRWDLTGQGTVHANNLGTFLEDVAGLGQVASADEFIVSTAAGVWALENAATARASMGAQTQGDVLDDLNTLGAVGGNGEFLVGTAAGVLAWESGATARTSLGLGTGDSPQFTNATLTGDLTMNTDGGFEVVSTSLATVSQTAIASWATATYGAVKLWIVVHDTTGNDRELVEMSIIHDGTTALSNEHGGMETNASLASFDVDVNGGNFRLLATSASTNNTEYKVVAFRVTD